MSRRTTGFLKECLGLTFTSDCLDENNDCHRPVVTPAHTSASLCATGRQVSGFPTHNRHAASSCPLAARAAKLRKRCRTGRAGTRPNTETRTGSCRWSTPETSLSVGVEVVMIEAGLDADCRMGPLAGGEPHVRGTEGPQ